MMAVDVSINATHGEGRQVRLYTNYNMVTAHVVKLGKGDQI